MNYLLNLSLPLWWMFLPLIIALYLASKKYKWKAKYYAAQYKAENNALQLIRDFERHKAESEKCQAEIKALKHDAAEREALITSLDKKVLELTDSLTFSDRLVKLGDTIEKQLLDKIEQLESKLQLSEPAHNETKADLEQIQADLAAAIAIMNRTVRGRKQWGKYKQSLVNNRMKEIREAKSENIIHDILGVARVFEADQSESVNNRHIQDLGSEVVRGIAEQKKAIEKEMQGNGVDMSQIEVGDKIVHRNKMQRIVSFTDNYINDDGERVYAIRIDNSSYGIVQPQHVGKIYFTSQGHYTNDGVYNDFDIVQIIKQPKFDPQLGERVWLVDYVLDEFAIESIDGNMYKLKKVYGIQWLINKPFQDLKPIIGATYQNGYKKDSNTCYKEPNKTCIYDCDGLCKNS